jgi:hypothetical protein
MIMRTGKPIEARFRNQDDEEWEYNWLCGWESSLNYLNELANPRKHCQVYDPQEWFLNKPEPGEGYRLLEKFPHEDLRPGDEAHDLHHKGEWSESQYARDGVRQQVENIWYRRLIETNNPTSSDSSRSRDTIPTGWRVLGKDEERLASDAYWSQGCKDWIVLGDDRVGVANRSGLHAIRQAGCLDLIEGFSYKLPSGQTIRITAKGFEVG